MMFCTFFLLVPGLFPLYDEDAKLLLGAGTVTILRSLFFTLRETRRQHPRCISHISPGLGILCMCYYIKKHDDQIRLRNH